MVTLKHIAHEAGVSPGAVSKVLNGRGTEARISPERAALISSIARRLNYHPNAAARSMRSRQTGHVGLLIPNARDFPATNPQAYYTIIGVNLGLESAGYVLSLVRITDVADLAAGDDEGARTGPARAGQSRVFRERMLDGMIVITHVPAAFAERVERLVPRVVWADANVWRDRHCIRRDEFHAGRTAAEGLLAAGYRRLVWHGTFDADAHTHYSHGDRLAGVRAAATAAAAVLVELKTDWCWRGGLVSQYRPLLRPDTAVIAEDVLRARMVAHAAWELRRTPGADFGLACCEDTPEVANTWPDLARVEFDRYDLGRRAAEMLAARLANPDAGCASYQLRGRWIAGRTARRGAAEIADGAPGLASPADAMDVLVHEGRRLAVSPAASQG
jgi:LacI family transcriptional regulator